METLSRPPLYEPQQELIRHACREAEERIAGARDNAEALRIRDEVCDRFGRECQSTIVVRALRDYLTEVIRGFPARPASNKEPE